MSHRVSQSLVVSLAVALATLGASQGARATPPVSLPGHAATAQTTAGEAAGGEAAGKASPGPASPGPARSGAARSGAAGASGASNMSPVDTSSCTPPTLTQPFQSVHDNHSYMLMPGETAGNLNGAGWTLLHGAKIVTARLAGGGTGMVLDLPSGAEAITPTICVTSQYPTGRTMIRDVAGHGGMSFYMSLAGTRTWNAPLSSGRRHGKHGAWSLTNRLNLHPPHVQGWHLMRMKLVARGQASEMQLYNFYVDPRMKW